MAKETKKMAPQPIIGIIGGKGKMGKLFVEFFVERGIKVLIADLGTKLTNRQLAASSDIVIISVPINFTEKVIKEVLPFVRPEAALMDFTSIKVMPVELMLKGKSEVLGIHPMFGNSNPIPGQTIILCPTKKSAKWSKWIEEFFILNGAKIEKMTAKEHDKIMNVAQGLIHFVEIVFADAIRRTGLPIHELLRYTGKASELKVQLAARIIDQDPALYGNIQIENKYALDSLKLFLKSTEELFKIVKQKDLKSFIKYFSRNKEFYKKYAHEAYSESTFLLDRMLERRNLRKLKNTKTQKPTLNHLAILGPANTFSDFAGEKYLKESNSKLKKYFATNIEEIFDLVESGKVSLGIVPIENKIHGSVRETLDSLFSKKVQIIDELKIPIHHTLISLSHGKRNDINVIASHSQAINQCRAYLKKHFPKAEFQEFPSTAQALEKLIASNNPTIAVIASAEAANQPNLKILAENIEDNKENQTTFVIIKKSTLELTAQPTKPKLNKTSIAFYFDKDAPGSLFTVFQDFASAKINLTKIESRPTKADFGDYIFYLDFDGHISQKNIHQTLQKVASKVAKLKILGSY